MSDEYYDAAEMEQLTGVPRATWRYYVTIGYGPASVKIGRRRVWKKATVHAWLSELEEAGNG